MDRKTRLAVVVSHPIQHFAPWHQAVARAGDLHLRVFFCCDWGVREFRDPDFAESFEWDVPLVEGYEHEFLPIARRPQQLSFREVDNPAVGSALDRFDPDVVQVFGWAYRTNWRAVGWARRHRRPVLLYTDSNVRALDAESAWKRLARRAVIGSFYRRVDGALSMGENNRAYHLRFGLPEDRVFTGVCPIDCSRLRAAVPNATAARRRLRQELAIPQDAFVVLSCGKYVPRKRNLDVAAAVASLADRGDPVRAILVGEGPDRARIESFLQNRDIESVLLTGFVNQSRIPQFYAAADVLAIASDFDPHPLVVSEGAAFGLPILASDAIGCIGDDDTARPGVNALVYPCGDWVALRDAIAQLLHNFELRKRLSEGSEHIGEAQDVSVAAKALAHAAQTLRRIGSRQD